MTELLDCSAVESRGASPAGIAAAGFGTEAQVPGAAGGAQPLQQQGRQTRVVQRLVDGQAVQGAADGVPDEGGGERGRQQCPGAEQQLIGVGRLPAPGPGHPLLHVVVDVEQQMQQSGGAQPPVGGQQLGGRDQSEAADRPSLPGEPPLPGQPLPQHRDERGEQPRRRGHGGPRPDCGGAKPRGVRHDVLSSGAGPAGSLVKGRAAAMVRRVGRVGRISSEPVDQLAYLAYLAYEGQGPVQHPI